MDSKTYDLLKRIATECRDGRELTVSGDDFDTAWYIAAKPLAHGVLDGNLDGSRWIVFDSILADGVDAIRAWENRWQRRAADHGARTFYAFLSALFIFLFGLFADCIKARSGRHDRAAEDERQHSAALPHVLEAPVVPAAALDESLPEARALGVLAERFPDRRDEAGGESEDAEKQRPK